jgi:hypothetical protein
VVPDDPRASCEIENAQELAYEAYLDEDDLERDGPAAASKAAHCAVEALDRTLRAAAPDDAVLSWHATTGRPASELTDRRLPTRALRVRFLASQTGERRHLSSPSTRA